MRFHVLGLFHTITSKEMLACAFTQKVVKFIDMMKATPEEKIMKKSMTIEEIIRHKTIHELIHYGHEHSIVDVDEHVTVMTDAVWREAYGEYDWRSGFFKFAQGDLAHLTFNKNAMIEIEKRKQPGDIILCFWGLGHQEIHDMFQNICLCVEPGIGYPPASAVYGAHWKVFESYAVMHQSYGVLKITQPPNYNCVIPNYFDPNDFDFVEEKGNYFLYLGRVAPLKGMDIVFWLARNMGFRLLVAGQGTFEKELGETDIPSNIEHVGFADVEKRKRLMANARAVILPTKYIEPFGGVTMEAMMSGTPVITCDVGVFAETVIHGVTGYRCRTLDHYMWAINNIDKISPKACRDWAMNNYSLTKIRLMYEEYFDMLLKVRFAKGYNQDNPDRTELDWLSKEYPGMTITRNVNKKPKIAFITETKWAFGRISNALTKFSKKYSIDILDWGQIIDPKRLESYDLLYLQTWDNARKFELMHPQFQDKIIFSGHGLVDFIKMKFTSTDNLEISEADIDKFDVDPEITTWMENRKLPFSVVSHQLMTKFSKLTNICLTQCGADDTIFVPMINNNSDKIRVLYPYPEVEGIGRGYGYDPKRKHIVLEIKKLIKDAKLPVEIVFTDAVLPLDKMPEFYHKGDIFLCVSHSEGNPLGAFEAGLSGLIVITTPVGEMPVFIKDAVNGYLIEGDIAKSVVEKLKLLVKNKKLLPTMKSNMIDIANNWTWEKKISQWDDYFDKCMNIINVKKSSLAIVTETKWAFGRIAQALKKHSKKFRVDIIDWSNKPGLNILNKYDLLYLTVWDIARKFEVMFPQLQNKIIFSGHGIIDYIKMKFNTVDIKVTDERVHNFIVDPNIINWLAKRKCPHSVVSHQLYDKLTKSPYQLTNVYLTQCGADDKIFYPSVTTDITEITNDEQLTEGGLSSSRLTEGSLSSARLKILFTFPESAKIPRDTYDPKRKYLVQEIKEAIKDMPFDIVFTPDFLHLDRMPDFYRQGDVFLCVSDCEGNPLGAFEAGLSGLVIISTRVGEMEYFIKDGVNGFLIDNGDDKKIVKDIIDKLTLLSEDKILLNKMKKNSIDVSADWTWEKKIEQWDEFFTKCLAK